MSDVITIREDSDVLVIKEEEKTVQVVTIAEGFPGYTPIKGIDYFDGDKGDTGDTGEQGIQGIPGLDGKSLEFHWNGTQLGIRIEGETTYQYVNLKGDKGEQGEDGERGIQGLAGKNLEFTWSGTQLGIRQEGQTNYTYVDLKGAKGDTGDTGATGKSIEFNWNSTNLGVRQEGETNYLYVDLKGEQGIPGEPGYTPIKGIDYFDGEKGEQGEKGYTPIKGIDYFDGDKGDTGEKGDPGDTGEPGYTPIKGIDYFDGDKGEKGETGDIANLTSQHVTTALGYSPISPTQLNSKVQTDVPSGAKFTDTITTINGKTGTILKADIVALGIPAQDTVYTHPVNHPPSIISQDANNRFVTDTEKSTWNSKSDTDTVTTVNGKTGAISKADIVALGIPSQDTNTTYSEITTAEIDTGNASTLRTITARRLKYLLDKIVALFPSKTSELTNDSGFLTSVSKADVGLGNVDNTSDLNKPISTATQTALNGKVDNSRVLTDVPLNAEFTDTIVDISGKQDKLTAGDNVTITNNTISATDTKYTHPTHTTKANGLYKVTVDNQGHVSATSVVAKADITALGIPAQDTVVDISGKLNKSNDTLETYTEKIQATTDIINLSLANVFTDTPSASRTYSITNAKSGVAHSFTLIITMGATVQTLTFPASVKWQGGEIPDMSTANKTYVLTFVSVNGGTTWLGMFGGDF